MPWNPAAVWREVRVTDDELAAIHRRMAGQPRDAAGRFPADAVFEGGGVWGTAFLGAVRCGEDVGLSWVGLAGTSAGAVTAGLLAAGYTAAELEAEFAALDQRRFVGHKTYRLGWDGDPADDLESAGELIGLLAALRTWRRLGRYRTDPFHDWYAGLLAAKGVRTFADVFRPLGSVAGAAGRTRVLPRQLRVVATDLTHGRMRVLPDAYLTPDAPPLGPEVTALPADLAAAPVAHAVRCSMSIPGFFEPARLPAGDPGGAVVVDGGLLSNFPLWLFDDGPGDPPGWPTFGFRLSAGPARRRPIATVTDLVAAMFRTMMTAADAYYLTRAGGNRVVDVDLSGVLAANPRLTPTAFHLTGDDQAALYRAGYLAAKRFFLTAWDWREHVRARVSSPTAAAAAAATGG